MTKIISTTATIRVIASVMFGIGVNLIQASELTLQTDQVEVHVCLINTGSLVGLGSRLQILVLNESDQWSYAFVGLRDSISGEGLQAENMKEPFGAQAPPGESTLTSLGLRDGNGMEPARTQVFLTVCVGTESTFSKIAARTEGMARQEVCEAIGGVFASDTVLVNISMPKGQDLEYFNRYIKYGKDLGDRNATRARLHAAMKSYEAEIREAELRPFEEWKQTEQFKQLEDTTYFAAMENESSSLAKVSRTIDYITEQADYFNRGKEKNIDRDSILRARHHTQRALYFTERSDLAWSGVLHWVKIGYLGTEEHREGVELLDRIARESTDCAVREIAKRAADAAR